MICCENCFSDIEIKAIIRGLNNIGNCDTCDSESVHIYDTDVNDQLVDDFNGLLDVYYSDKNLPDDFPKEKLTMLKDELYDNWNIFAIQKEKVYNLIKHICSEKYTENPDLFDSPVGILEANDSEYLREYSLMKTHKWSDFVNEITKNNRFHTNYINTSILDLYCNNSKQSFPKGTVFYRARISSKSGYPKEKMGPPPTGKASAGRANPLGISCLYLSDDIKTTIHEIRAGAYDFVTVGEFELLEDIEVVDFTLFDKISPFTLDGKTQYAINLPHLRNISYEIAKPLRRNDSPLDYLPTQYIVDFIKSKEHSGVKYQSTMNKNGYNVAVFKENIFKCRKVDVYDVRSINYDYIRV